MYNFGVLSFWSFNTKFKVILKIQISEKCPLFQIKPPIQNPLGILKSGQHESCRAQKVEQLSCWEFFKLFRKNKSNFGNSNLPQVKNLNPLKLNFDFQTVLAKFTLLHSKSALVTEICCVAYKIWNNFCFDTNLTPVQISVEICKTPNWVDMHCYSDRQGGCSDAGAEPPPRATPRSWPRSCLLLCFAWTASSTSPVPPHR